MNAATYTTILQEHRDRIYGRALYVLGDADDAADVTQDVFLRLWRSGGDVDPERVAGWLTRVAHNLCIDHIRRRQVVRTRFGMPDVEAVALLPAAPHPRHDPDSWLELDERQRLLMDAMATLTADTRSVMIMHYFQDMKLQEIAVHLDKTVAALKVQIHRARKALRNALETDEGWQPAARRETG